MPAVAADCNPGMAFVGNPTDVLLVATTKTATDSNEPLLGPDATQATARSVLGVPLYSSPAVDVGSMWLVPRDKCFVVMRDDPQVIADTSAFFSSDRTRDPRCAPRRLRLPARASHHPCRHRWQLGPPLAPSSPVARPGRAAVLHLSPASRNPVGPQHFSGAQTRRAATHLGG